jgi:type IX secretion system PorP/SprF family membrane protein
MKKNLLYVLFTLQVFSFTTSQSQDIPLFSQKLTNSFVYNPSLAGLTFGSLTYSYKQNYSNVNGAPQNHFVSVHTPLGNHKFGIGANFFQEDVTFLSNRYASAAFAYHLRFDKFTTLSMGVSGEYNSIGLNGTPKGDDYLTDPDYIMLQNGRSNNLDFSFGMHFQNRYLKGGIAANRLASNWKTDTTSLSLTNFYSSFVQGLIPIRGGEDLLEPYVAFRKMSDINNTLDLGLFYTYNDKITAGVSMRSGKVLGATLAFRPSKYLMLGVSRESITSNVGGFVGAAYEFTLRYDFNNESYKERFRADYKSSMAYRRKTLSGPVGKAGGRSPQQLHRKQKKVAPYSPNNRYQNIKKLGVKKKKPASKKTFNAQKRKRTNYKRNVKNRRR